ncbi:MAG: type III pantothenate kinase [Bacteroidetes bacterium]|nr:type III pantothenate kinase [Bacteroidota bacterium]
MRLLALDIGNTARKWALLQEGRVVAHGHWQQPRDLPQDWQRLGWIASGQVDAPTQGWLQARQSTQITGQTPGLLQNAYQTPHTLGADRWAAINGAWALAQGKPAVVFDLGTALTCEVAQEGSYLGGSISPGLHLRLEALHRHTAQLPLPDVAQTYHFPALNTREALLAGAVQGVFLEITGRISLLTAQLGEHPQVYICGGDAPFFENHWKTPIFARPHLVAEGIWHLMQLQNA